MLKFVYYSNCSWQLGYYYSLLDINQSGFSSYGAHLTIILDNTKQTLFTKRTA